MPSPTLTPRKIWNPTARRHREQGEAAWPAVAAQTTSTVTSAWLRVGVGSNMVAQIVATALTGTLDVAIETAQTNETTPATLRTIDSFETMEAAGTVRASFPCTDEYVRFVADPGAGGGQTASYTVTATVVPIS